MSTKSSEQCLIEWVNHEWSLREFSVLTVDEGQVIKRRAAEIVAVLARHFKEGVAYMPVPRCETCKHWANWTAYAADEDYGDCALHQWRDHDREPPHAYVSADRPLSTRQDFGCVRWEEKR